MAEQNRCKELESLLASFQNPGLAMPTPELAEYLRLVRTVAVHCSKTGVTLLLTCSSPLQLRDLRIRDSENVVLYGGHNLQQLAAAVPEEERRSTQVLYSCAVTVPWTVSADQGFLCSVASL